jgi:hypothetical protein
MSTHQLLNVLIRDAHNCELKWYDPAPLLWQWWDVQRPVCLCGRVKLVDRCGLASLDVDLVVVGCCRAAL